MSNATYDLIYFQIATQIKREIMKGELSSGEMLPSIRSLAKELRIRLQQRTQTRCENEKIIC
ncbi:MAG: GntR family transcriptional regulator [Alkaliphilus sp.]